MEVVLLREVRRLGKEGDIKHVADGYARNYLIPRGLAVPATERARKQVAERAASAARQEVSAKAAAEAQAANLEKIELLFRAKSGEGGRLYGSVTAADVAEQLSTRIGTAIDKRKVLLPEPIKELGKTQVDVKLHSEVRITVSVIVQANDE